MLSHTPEKTQSIRALPLAPGLQALAHCRVPNVTSDPGLICAFRILECTCHPMALLPSCPILMVCFQVLQTHKRLQKCTKNSHSPFTQLHQPVTLGYICFHSLSLLLQTHTHTQAHRGMHLHADTKREVTTHRHTESILTHRHKHTHRGTHRDTYHTPNTRQ